MEKTGERRVGEVRLEAFRIKTGKQKIKIVFSELTFKCPKTGYPDFAEITLEYIPKEIILELKSFKLWLNSFRDTYIGYEKLSDKIFQELFGILKPQWMKITLKLNPRGNVHTSIVMEEGNKKL